MLNKRSFAFVFIVFFLRHLNLNYSLSTNFIFSQSHLILVFPAQRKCGTKMGLLSHGFKKRTVQQKRKIGKRLQQPLSICMELTIYMYIYTRINKMNSDFLVFLLLPSAREVLSEPSFEVTSVLSLRTHFIWVVVFQTSLISISILLMQNRPA